MGILQELLAFAAAAHARALALQEEPLPVAEASEEPVLVAEACQEPLPPTEPVWEEDRSIPKVIPRRYPKALTKARPAPRTPTKPPTSTKRARRAMGATAGEQTGEEEKGRMGRQKATQRDHHSGLKHGRKFLDRPSARPLIGCAEHLRILSICA